MIFDPLERVPGGAPPKRGLGSLPRSICAANAAYELGLWSDRSAL